MTPMNPANNTYRLFVPKQAVGANLVYFDLFNKSDTGVDLLIASVVPIVSGAVAVTSTLGVDLHLTRTSAVGTGGTAATREGTDTTACTISNMVGGGNNLNGGVTARLTPTGGATAGAVLGWCCVATEETLDGPYFAAMNDLVRRSLVDIGPIIVPPSSGIRVVQGAVASAGNIGFDVIFQSRHR